MSTSTTQRIINFGEKMWGVLSLVLPQFVMDWLGTSVAKMLFFYSDRSLGAETAKNRRPIPPAPLRYRVWGDPDISTFLWSGDHCRKDIDRALQQLGIDWNTSGQILDFGCGCGRIFSYLPEEIHTRYVGVDTDGEAIAWCNKNHPQVTFLVNDPAPTLYFPDATFDLILAIAVFRHLDEENQFLWLEELRRVVKPGGIVMISLHGRFCWQGFAESETKQLEEVGFLCKPLKDPYQRSIFPEWYQATYHHQDYIMKHYVKYFEIVEYITRGIENETDLVLCRKTNLGNKI
jgi:SAM-dependent methyltransferase